MARKPIKKRKIVRKIVKKRIKAPKKPVVFNPKFDLKIGTLEDPFHIHQETVPEGVALQWITLSADDLVRVQASGWQAVEGQDAIKGNLLVWAPKALADAQRDANIQRAKDQVEEVRALFQMDAGGHREGTHFLLVSESFMVSSDYGCTPTGAKPLDVEIKVNFRLSWRFQDAAASLGLSPQEYAQRRMSLYVSGVLGGIIMPADGNAIELFEDGNFNIVSRN